MDAKDALDRLLRVSDDISAAVVFERGGEPAAATVPDEEARELARLAEAILDYAEGLRDGVETRQVHAVITEGDVYVVRDNQLAVVAVAAAGSLPGLVQHDLGTLLRDLSAPTRSEASAVS